MVNKRVKDEFKLQRQLKDLKVKVKVTITGRLEIDWKQEKDIKERKSKILKQSS